MTFDGSITAEPGIAQHRWALEMAAVPVCYIPILLRGLVFWLSMHRWESKGAWLQPLEVCALLLYCRGFVDDYQVNITGFLNSVLTDIKSF